MKKQRDQRVIDYLREHGDWAFALEIMRGTRLHSGYFYPAISRLMLRGVVEREREENPLPRTSVHRIKYRLAELKEGRVDAHQS